MSTIKIANLKTLFELRKTKPFAKRTCSGRVFFYQNKLGLCDATGFLWPVFLDTDDLFPDLKTGDVLIFKSHFIYSVPVEETDNKKYDDLHYTLNIQQIFEHVPCLQEWENPVVPNPLPNLEEQNLKSLNYTCYYKSVTKSRFNLLNKRIKSLERVKQYFVNRDFIHIETPTLVPSGTLEPYLNPFLVEYTDHRLKKIQLQLPTSPEFALKKILAEGVHKIFQISRSYRNHGELSQWHEPEFFMLEWYRIGANLKDILNDTQNLVTSLAEFLGSSLDIPKNWPRFRVDELFKNLLHLNLNELQHREDFYKAAKPLSLSIVETDTWDDIFCKLFMEKIEPYLKEQKACFVTHYPVQMAALAAVEVVESKTAPNQLINTNFAQRAEAFLHGIEICNAYLELVDAKALQTRILKTQKMKAHLFTDPLFENAMNFGLPPCAGNALGLDRVIALLLGIENIASLYPIPFLGQFKRGDVAEE